MSVYVADGLRPSCLANRPAAPPRPADENDKASATAEEGGKRVDDICRGPGDDAGKRYDEDQRDDACGSSSANGTDDRFVPAETGPTLGHVLSFRGRTAGTS